MMEEEQVSWRIVSGFGAHIKATPTSLLVLQNGQTREYPLSSLDHLVLAGGHTLQTSAITHLLKKGASISFFNADSEFIGMLRPPEDAVSEEMEKLQKAAPPHPLASTFARATLNSRLLLLEKTEEELKKPLFYEGELDFLHATLQEIEYLIRMDELRRIHRLTTDMYYEIFARSLPPEAGFRRRTPPPHPDPINTLLSYGYTRLFATCLPSLVGARLDPDSGYLFEGEGALVFDLMEPFKARMVDSIVLTLVRGGLLDEGYECGTRRCHLGEGIIHAFHTALKDSIDERMVAANILSLVRSIKEGAGFHVLY